MIWACVPQLPPVHCTCFSSSPHAAARYAQAAFGVLPISAEAPVTVDIHMPDGRPVLLNCAAAGLLCSVSDGMQDCMA